MKVSIILLNTGFVKKPFEEGAVKVKDHDHVTGKYPGSAHQECNLNLSLSKKILIMINILTFKKLESMI